MKRISYWFVPAALLLVSSIVYASNIRTHVSGRILLQVQSHGEAWYVNPDNNERYYLKDGVAAYQLLRSLGLGITNGDLAKIPVVGSAIAADNNLVTRLKGRILLQVQSHGEAWYVNPVNGERYYLRDGNAAYTIMRSLGLGITNSDLAQIPVFNLSSPPPPLTNNVAPSQNITTPTSHPAPTASLPPLVSSGSAPTGFLQNATAPCASGEVNFYGVCVDTIKLFGQSQFGEATQNEPTGRSLYHSAGIAVDNHASTPRLYVVDTGNNRVLAFPDAHCLANQSCGSAQLIFGQGGPNTGACNHDDNLGLYGNAGADSLCLTSYPEGTNISEQWMHFNIDVDAGGNLYVIDAYNNRVIKYNAPFSTDHSGGKGDTIADFVWGQNDFTGAQPNKGQTFIDATTLNLGIGTGYVSTRGVSVDSSGNVWVADTYNGRVLRFPPNSKTADLVIGQNSFVTHNQNCNNNDTGDTTWPSVWATNQFCKPTLARVDPVSGDLYVIDEHNPAFKTRILRFPAPLKTGESADDTMYVKAPPSQLLSPSNQNYFFTADSLAFNTYKQGDYAGGHLWVTEHWPGRRILLLDDQSDIIKVIGGRDTWGDHGAWADDPGAGCSTLTFRWPSGSIGFDAVNNMYVSDEWGGVSQVSLPYTLTTNANGNTCLPAATGQYFVGNEQTNSKWLESVGMTIADNQLIVQDQGRILVWDNYLSKQNGAPADHIISTPGLTRVSFAVDDQHHLWTTSGSGKLAVYQLPLKDQSSLLASGLDLHWSNDGSPIDYSTNGPAFDATSHTLWLPDNDHHRVLRVSNYAAFASGNLKVDEVIGQPDKQHVACNQNQTENWTASGAPGPSTLCHPYKLQFDRVGNLYVIEDDYECHGNARISVFIKDDIDHPSSLFPNISARNVFGASSLTSAANCNDPSSSSIHRPISIAFNMSNQMVVGTDGYYYSNNMLRELRQLYVVNNPLLQDSGGHYVLNQAPNANVYLPIGATADLQFDASGNLVVQDHTWARVWVVDANRLLVPLR